MIYSVTLSGRGSPCEIKFGEVIIWKNSQTAKFVDCLEGATKCTTSAN
jgi:hypothetical protein